MIGNRCELDYPDDIQGVSLLLVLFINEGTAQLLQYLLNTCSTRASHHLADLGRILIQQAENHKVDMINGYTLACFTVENPFPVLPRFILFILQLLGALVSVV